MAERNKNMRENLLLAGIRESNTNGVHSFSVRRVAEACGVSCAAPYKHFKDKREFIAAIIDYVNGLWRERQLEVLAECSGSHREQIVRLSVEYVRFLMEKPFYRSILMLRDEEFDNLYHRVRGEMSSRSQQLQQDFFAASGMDEATRRRKLHVVRAMIFGTVFLMDSREIPYSEETLEHLRHAVDREFDLP